MRLKRRGAVRDRTEDPGFAADFAPGVRTDAAARGVDLPLHL